MIWRIFSLMGQPPGSRSAHQIESQLPQTLFQQVGLCGLAAAVRALHGQEEAPWHGSARTEQLPQLVRVADQQRGPGVLQFFHAAAAVDRADAVHPGSLGAFHIVQPVAHHGGALVMLRQRPADHFRLAQLGVAVRFPDDPVEIVPQAVMTCRICSHRSRGLEEASAT